MNLRRKRMCACKGININSIIVEFFFLKKREKKKKLEKGSALFSKH